MKLNYLRFFILFTFLYACSSNKQEKMIAQKWQCVDFNSEEMEKELITIKGVADTSSDSTIKAIALNNLNSMNAMKDEMKQMRLIYNPDKSFESAITILGQPKTQKGTWELSSDGKYIITRINQSVSDTGMIDFLDPQKLVLSGFYDGNKITVTFSAIP